MQIKQHTIKERVSVQGVGLHTGVNTTMTFCPAAPDHGIKFQRIDLPEKPIVEADADLVVDVSRGTTIEKNDARVGTIEHTLAALMGLEIDNVLIEIDGPECPIMDGSSLPFIETIEKVGLEEQNALRNFFEVPQSITYRDKENNVEIAALPLDDYRVTVMIDYNSPVLGSQHATLNKIEDFKAEVSSSRTFCFLHELEQLYQANLIRGGDLNNAIVVVDREVEEGELDYLADLFNKPKVSVQSEGILNNVELRHNNEPARHKLLDMVGDLALAGRPLKAQILAARPGHASNVAFAKKLKRAMEDNKNVAPHYDPKLPPLFDAQAIYSLLPHRYPFQLVDKIIYLDDNIVAGVKNVTLNEPFFQGHFPDNPVMPGVLQVEAMAQCGGILVLNSIKDPENYWAYFLGIENCRFKRMVVPGDTIIFRCELMAPLKRGIAKFHGQAFVGGKLAAEAVVIASLVKKTNES
jgi:UDP-3-O-[3-hydroxymyristoyl] N-acetylglucosamine deacetylase/3-hydroxyacyl-[acyl-carrier-protein] dehydratase